MSPNPHYLDPLAHVKVEHHEDDPNQDGQTINVEEKDILDPLIHVVEPESNQESSDVSDEHKMQIEEKEEHIEDIHEKSENIIMEDDEENYPKNDIKKELSNLRFKRYRERKKKEGSNKCSNELLRERLKKYREKKEINDECTKELFTEYFKIYKYEMNDEHTKKLSRERSKRYRERKRLQKRERSAINKEIGLGKSSTNNIGVRKQAVNLRSNFMDQNHIHNPQIEGPCILNNEGDSHSSELTVSSNNFDELNINLDSNTQNEDISSVMQQKDDTFILGNTISLTDFPIIVSPVSGHIKINREKTHQNDERSKELSRERSKRYRERKRLERLNAITNETGPEQSILGLE